MNLKKIQKIQLTEIRDYRGNLSFAEEGNPIPFDIKSVFWSTVSTALNLQSAATLFLICLDGELEVNGIELLRPCEACHIPPNVKFNITPSSKDCKLLLVMDQAIDAKDHSTDKGKHLLEMPYIKDFLGMEGYYANSKSTLPFDIKRVYFTYDIPNFAKRGGHAHIYTKEIVFPVKGQFDVIVEQNKARNSVHLNTENQGIFLNTGIWRELENFTDQSLVLVLASETYYEEDYIREYEKYSVKY